MLQVGSGTRPLIVGLGGTTRPNSATEKALRIALNSAAAEGADTVLIGGVDLQFPMYEPGDLARLIASGVFD